MSPLLRFSAIALLCASFLVWTVQTIHAAIPAQINFQGQLTNSSGVPLDTTVSMTIRVYNVSSEAHHSGTRPTQA